MKKKEERLIPVVTTRSVIPIIEMDIDAEIDTALRQQDKRMKRRYWHRRMRSSEEDFPGRLYCLLNYLETFF